MFDLDDLVPFLALLRDGSTHRAAAAMGVNQSTIQRRIVRLETALGLTLFRRDERGYHPTEHALALEPVARAAETAALALARAAAERARAEQEVLRITCPGPLAARLQASEFIASFRARHPLIGVELLIDDGYVDLVEGAADVALRSGEAADERLVGKRVGVSHWGAYASAEMARAFGPPATISDLDKLPFIGFSGDLAANRGAVWLARTFPQARITARSNSMLGVVEAALSGLGVALLPVVIARSHPSLVELTPSIPALERGWYLLTTPDLRKTARVARFFDHAGAHRAALRRVLMG